MTERLPLYKALANTLEQRIFNGDWPVGSVLPAEADLCRDFQSSRHTLRHALQILEANGLIYRHQGAPTKVVSRQRLRRFTQSFNSPIDILSYSRDTYRENLIEEYIELDESLSQIVGAPVGSSWYHIEAVRRDEASGQPVSWSDIYIQSQFAKVTKMRNHQREIVFEQIERYFGVSIDRAVVEVQAESLSAVHARHLQAPRGSPSLAITRRYYDQAGQVFEVTVTRHVPDRFQFALELRSVGRTRVVSETHEFS